MDIAKLAADHGLSSDEVRARWLTMKAAQWKSDFKLFARECLKIRAKDGDLVPLVLNESQTILHNAAETMAESEGWVRLLSLKGRRQGFSTYVAARGFWRCTLYNRQRIYLLSHEMTSTAVLFDMVALFQEKHPFPNAVGTDNAKSLTYDQRGSSYTVATAGQKAGGRGGAVSFFHGSEAAYWTNASDHFASSVQAVDEVKGVKGVLWTEPANPLPFERGKGEIRGWVKAPSEVHLETTSAGPSGDFYRRYREAMQGEGRYRHVFAPWTVQAEYHAWGDWNPGDEPEEDGELSEREYQDLHGLSDGQMLWRREKIHELGSLGRFRQEFPVDITEAFATANIDGVFIPPSLVLKARKKAMTDPDAPLIIGVDPAGAGGDRFAVAARRGDKCLWVRHRNKLEHEDAVAWLSEIIDEYQPSRMCIDRGSMGSNIISTLRHIHPSYSAIVKGIDFGGTSKAKKTNPKRAGPWNVRAEIYGRMRDWLTEGGSIPDDDDLASDMSGPRIKFRANNDWILESKSDMKMRGLRSTDLSDALALTFSTQEFFAEWGKPKPERGFNVGVPRQGSDIYDNDAFDEMAGVETGWML